MTDLLKYRIHWWRLRTDWYRKKLVLKQPPYFVNLEPTGFCNLRCTVCSYQQNRGRGYFDMELAEKVIAEAADFGVSQMRFYLAGEPLFHPHLDDMIRMARKRGMLTQVHTNATILDEKRSNKILDSGLDSISFSFDGENAEEYEAVRVGSKFDATLNNIIRFLQMKKDRGVSQPFVTFQVIKIYHPGSPFSPHISPEFKKHFDGLPIDQFRVLYPSSFPGLDRLEVTRPTGKTVFPCLVLWQSLSVGWDGKILGCCGDLNGVMTLGDVRNDRLKDVWNSELMVWMRRQHVLKNHHSIPLCRDCDAVYKRTHPAIHDLKELFTGKWTPL